MKEIKDKDEGALFIVTGAGLVFTYGLLVPWEFGIGLIFFSVQITYGLYLIRKRGKKSD